MVIKMVEDEKSKVEQAVEEKPEVETEPETTEKTITPEIIKSNEKALATQDWYKAMIEECGAIIVEGVFTSQWELIKTWHLLGERICQEFDNFERSKIYGKQVCDTIAKSLGKQKRSVQRAIQFYKKYPELDKLECGKNISWSKVCRQYLPEPKEVKPEPEKGVLDKKGFVICPQCNNKFKVVIKEKIKNA